MDQAPFSTELQFLAQVAHIHLDDVAGATVLIGPDHLQDRLAAHHGAGLLQQQLQ